MIGEGIGSVLARLVGASLKAPCPPPLAAPSAQRLPSCRLLPTAHFLLNHLQGYVW